MDAVTRGSFVAMTMGCSSRVIMTSSSRVMTSDMRIEDDVGGGTGGEGLLLSL